MLVGAKLDHTQNSAGGGGESRQAVAQIAGVSHDTISTLSALAPLATLDKIPDV